MSGEDATVVTVGDDAERMLAESEGVEPDRRIEGEANGMTSTRIDGQGNVGEEQTPSLLDRATGDRDLDGKEGPGNEQGPEMGGQ